MTLFPLTVAASFTLRLAALGCAACLLAGLSGVVGRRRWLIGIAVGGLLLGGLAWGALWLSRPAWLRVARAASVPAPAAPAVVWTTRAPGLETAELELSAGEWVDRLVLARVEPARYQFRVGWDASRSRTVEEWRRALDAAVVINGSYFEPNGQPTTPLRIDGRAAGPRAYVSSHGAFVAGAAPAIVDLAGTNVLATIAPFPMAMVSYPLLVDERRQVRAVPSDWLASRSFLAMDGRGRVLFGTTRTGFFTLARLGAWLRDAPLDVRVALNLDGGPIASQAVHAAGFDRVVIGQAEINDRTDLARAWWQGQRSEHWKLPIVLAAIPK